MTTAQFAALALFVIVFSVVNLLGLLYHFGNQQSVKPFHPRNTPPKEPIPKTTPGQKGTPPRREVSPKPPLPRAA